MAGSSLGSIFIDLRANTADFVTGMTSASSAARKAGKEIEGSFSNLGNIAATALAPLGMLGSTIAQTFSQIGQLGSSAAGQIAGLSGGMSMLAVGGGVAVGAIGAVAAGAIGLAMHSAEGAAKMLELSKSAGVSVEALSGLSFVAKQAGVSTETMTTGLERMSKSAYAAAQAPAGAKNAYTQLGVSVKNADGTMRSAESIFTSIAAKFAAMPDGVNKTALAMQIFGRGGAALIPVLDMGAAGIQHWLDESKAFGATLTTETAEAAEKFRQSLNELELAGTGFANQLMAALLPSLQNFLSALAASPGQVTALVNGIVTVTKDLLNLVDALIFAGRAAAAFWKATEGWGPLSSKNIQQFRKDISDAYADMQKFDAFAKKPFDIGLAVRNQSRSKPGAAAGADQTDTSGTDKVRKAVDQLTASLQTQITTFGESALSVQEYKLRLDGATLSEIQGIERVRQLADAQKLNAQAQKEAAQAAKDAANAALTVEIRKQGAALEESMRASQQLGTAWQQLGSTGPAAFHGVDQQVQDLNKQLQEQITNYGKSATQIEIMKLAADGATADQIAGLKALDAQLGSLDQGVQKVSESWKKIGNEISKDISDMVLHGKSFVSVLKEIVDQMAQMLIKMALFGSKGNGGLLGGLGGSLTSLFSGLFGGGKAGGGSVSPSQIYAVGESGPEWFVPDTAGSIVSNSSSFGGTTNIYHIDARGATPGVDQDVMRALKASENRAVVRSLNAQRQYNLRTAKAT